MRAREVYCHVPDLSWPGWGEASLPLLARLGRPATIDGVIEWSLGPDFATGGQRMGVSRRTSYVRNMLAWLSLRGEVDFSRGRWRRVRARRACG